MKVLLIGESATAAGTLYYLGDTLKTYTHVAFSRAPPETKYLNPERFLKWFKENGFYHDDLCLTPVNRMIKKRTGFRVSFASRGLHRGDCITGTVLLMRSVCIDRTVPAMLLT